MGDGVAQTRQIRNQRDGPTHSRRMQMFLYGRDRYDPAMRVIQSLTRLVRNCLSSFHGNNACDDLQAVGHAMVNFIEHDVFLTKQLGILALQKTLARDILDTEKDFRGRYPIMRFSSRVEQHRSSSEGSKIMFNFIIRDSPLFGYDLPQK